MAKIIIKWTAVFNEINKTLTDIKQEQKKDKRLFRRLPHVFNYHIHNRVYFFTSILESYRTRYRNHVRAGNRRKQAK